MTSALGCYQHKDIEMNCPNCKSESIRKYSIIFQEGTYSSASKFDAGTSETTGFSELARRCSPPETKRPVRNFIIRFLIGFVFWLIVSTNLGSIWGNLLFIVLNGFFVKLLIQDLTFNKTIFPKLQDRWANSWLCMKCGHNHTI